jgi:hypothetical protein
MDQSGIEGIAVRRRIHPRRRESRGKLRAAIKNPGRLRKLRDPDKIIRKKIRENPPAKSAAAAALPEIGFRSEINPRSMGFGR